MDRPIIGICDYCQNTNRQQLTPYGEDDLCNRCLEDRRNANGNVAKRQRDEKFRNDYEQIVRGVRT